MEGEIGFLTTKDGHNTYEVPMVGLRLSKLFASTMIVGKSLKCKSYWDCFDSSTIPRSSLTPSTPHLLRS